MNQHAFQTLISSYCKRLLTILFVSLTSACNPFIQTTDLEKIQMRDAIVMGTINSSLTYIYDGESYTGLDYELGEKFADYLEVDFIVKDFDTLEALFFALNNKQIDFIGAGLTQTPKRMEQYRSSPPYYDVSQKLVYYKGTYRPRNLNDINATVSVLKNSSHEESMLNLLEDYPELTLDVFDNEDQESLLRKIAEKEITFAVVDSTTLAQKQRYYPALAEAFTISGELPVAWLLRKDQDDSLYSGMIEFMGQQYQSGDITRIEEKYFGHVASFDYVDTSIFLKRIKSKLPKYEDLFKKYATPEISWQLLAAVSYQESHWNPKALSPTGVRGMMMLTLNTAKDLGITDRVNPEQSIKGGAKYLTQLIKRLPASIPDDEKIWFALASYNIGLGHLLDARRITKVKKQDPNSWSDVKDNLPLLHQRKWYSKTRYGYARGREAQHYVNNIRQYLKTLTWSVLEQEKAEVARLEQQKLAKKMALQQTVSGAITTKQYSAAEATH